MGFIDNSTIVVDSILTKRGRELFLIGGNTKIVKYAFSDEGVDYTLWDSGHPDGPEAFGSVIENMNVLEATIDREDLKTFLIHESLAEDIAMVGSIEVDALSYDLAPNEELIIQPNTVGFTVQGGGKESSTSVIESAGGAGGLGGVGGQATGATGGGAGGSGGSEMPL